jgi:DNA polymerase-3 subunit delta'
VAETPYLEVFGHEEVRTRLTRAVERGLLPQSLLLYGPRGVGKQRLALWIAAALNCSNGPPRPCGGCRSCRLVGRLEHPDVHWFFPMTRPKGSTSPDRLERVLEDQRAEALEERRADPLYVEETAGVTGIYVAVVGVMRKLC